MPKLSVWLVRASLLHLGVGFLFGALILSQKGVPLIPWAWGLLSPHTEFVIFGWTMQFVMGIAFWILPRFSGERRYGNTPLGWWSFALLNGGILLTATGDWLVLGPLVLAGRLAVLGAVALFVAVLWPRVKPLGGYAAASVRQSDNRDPKEKDHESA
jgi:heme/copper-type cytochrome/quinol oxidase subunit 1